MTLTSLGDLSGHFLLRRQNTALRSASLRLGQQLASGEVSDPVRHLGADVSALTDIEWRRGLSSAFRQSTREATVMTTALQTALGRVQDLAGALGPTALLAAQTGPDVGLAAPARQAGDALAGIVAALNTQVAGRGIFAGVATDGPALAGADTLLSDLRLAVTGLTDPADVVAAVNDWFTAPGGGFESVGYLGSAQGLPPFRVAEGERVTLDIRATSPQLRNVMSAVALAALADDPALSLDGVGRRAMFAAAGGAMLTAQDALTGLRATLGVTEARLEETGVRLHSEASALELARSALLSVDPYDTATRLEQARVNLESLYAVTARLSRLRLTEYL